MADRLFLVCVPDSAHTERHQLVLPHGARVWGEFTIPNASTVCQCASRPGWVRGKKRGWMVCLICKKPNRSWRFGIGQRIFSALGINLIPENELPEEMNVPLANWVTPAFTPPVPAAE